MENSKLDENFEHDLYQILTEYYGEKWSNVWDKEKDGFILRIKVFGNILTKEDIPIVDDETDKMTNKEKARKFAENFCLIAGESYDDVMDNYDPETGGDDLLGVVINACDIALLEFDVESLLDQCQIEKENN